MCDQRNSVLLKYVFYVYFVDLLVSRFNKHTRNLTHILQYPVGLAQRANRGKKVCLGKLFHESVLYSQHKKTLAGLQQKEKSDRVRHQLQSHGYWLYYDVTASLSRDQDRRTVFFFQTPKRHEVPLDCAQAQSGGLNTVNTFKFRFDYGKGAEVKSIIGGFTNVREI